MTRCFAWCDDCSRFLPVTPAIWGPETTRQLQSIAEPCRDDPHTLQAFNHIWSCRGCRKAARPLSDSDSAVSAATHPTRSATPTGTGGSTSHPDRAPGDPVVRERLDRLEALLDAQPAPTPANPASEVSSLSATALAEALAPTQQLPEIRGVPILAPEACRSPKSVAMWRERAQRACLGRVRSSRVAAVAFSQGIDDVVKSAALKPMNVKRPGQPVDVERMTMTELVQLVELAFPAQNRSMQVSVWWSEIRCQGSPERQLDECILEFKSFLSMCPACKPEPDHGKAEMSRKFVLGMHGHSKLQGKLQARMSKWEKQGWEALESELGMQRERLHAEKNTAPTTLNVMGSGSWATPSQADEFSAAAREGEAFPTAKGAAQARSGKLEAELLAVRSERPAEAKARCPRCWNPQAKHTFETCTEAQRLQAKGMSCCELCWKEGRWFYRTHKKADCRFANGGGAPSPGPPPARLPIAQTAMAAVLSPLEEPGPGASERERTLFQRLMAIQSAAGSSGSPSTM